MNKLQIQTTDSLIKGAKLNFQNFQSLFLDDKNLELLELISSTISSGHLRNVNFFNASFLSTKLSEINFEGCNLTSTDICSVWASNCRFINSDFSDATISDTSFVKCIFDGAIFKSVSLTRCQFIDCTFEQFLMDDSTFSLNSFSRCHIKRTNFTESFYYQIFKDCTFNEVQMDPILLGYNFGFSDETFAQLTNNVNLNEIDQDFRSKELYINAAILRINQVQNYYDEALRACVSALIKMIQNDILIKADEIEFLKNLTLYFEEHNQIAPISILRIWRLLNDCLIAASPNVAVNKAAPHIREYSNMLYFRFIDFQKELQQCIKQFPQDLNNTDIAELKIVYSDKPAIPLLDYLIEFTALIDGRCPMPNLIRTEKGSFHEYHNIAIAIIPYLQTFMSLLGVVTPFIIYKKQKTDEAKKEQAKCKECTSESEKMEVEITFNSTGTACTPIFLPDNNSITPQTNNMISNVVKIVGNQKINGIGFGGYNTQNIQSITIRFQ